MFSRIRPGYLNIAVITMECYLLQRATWHVPPGQIPVALRGAAAAPHDVAVPPGSSKPPAPLRTNSNASTGSSSHSSHLSAFSHKSKQHQHNENDLTVEVALKVIPKKKVKGNESSVWGEMEVLRGLDHPNIVSTESSCLFHSDQY